MVRRVRTEPARCFAELPLATGTVPAPRVVPGNGDVDEALQEVSLRLRRVPPLVLELLVRSEELAGGNQLEATVESHCVIINEGPARRRYDWPRGKGRVLDEKPPRLDSAKVEAFVSKSHGDLEAVQGFLADEPELVNAAWDWGGGDWETGLGAAAHMGRRDIAEFLVGRGARIDIFAAAMLGQTAVVRSLLDAFPEFVDARGPHGIPLRVHAEKGGDQAKEVLALLEERSGVATTR